MAAFFFTNKERMKRKRLDRRRRKDRRERRALEKARAQTSALDGQTSAQPRTLAPADGILDAPGFEGMAK